MRCAVLIAASFVVCAIPVNAGYTYTITEGYESLPNLHATESLLMTGGGGYRLDLDDESSATIEGTSTLGEGTGGIWEIRLAAYSHLDFSGGEVHSLSTGNHATSTLSGGRIDFISSAQSAWKHAGDPPVVVPNPHITIVGDLDSVYHDVQTNVLTGNWLDGTGFNIQLVDVDGYSPAIENIQFIPEPATLILVVAGMALMRKRESRIV